MALGLVTLSIGFSWLNSLKRNVWLQQQNTNERRVRRTLTQFFSQDIRFAGYLGCRTRDKHFPLRSKIVDFKQPYTAFRTDRIVFGFQNSLGKCREFLSKGACQRAKPEGDVLVLHNIPKAQTRLTENMKSTTSVLQVAKKNAMREGSVALLSDYWQGDLFVIKAVHADHIWHEKHIGLNQVDAMSKPYHQGAEVIELQTIAYYLGIPERYSGSSQHYALYRDDLIHEADEVMGGIDRFEVLYGMLAPNGILYYQQAINIEEDEWAAVSSVQIIVKTKENTWEHEFAIRNRYNTTSTAYISRGNFNVYHSTDKK